MVDTLSPKTKIEVMTTYEQAVQKGKIEGKIEGKLQMLNKAERIGFSIELMVDLSDLPETTIKLWFGHLEMLQKCRLEQKTVPETAKIVQLTELQVTEWWAFFEKAETAK